MARSRVLVDSSFLYALFDEDDNKHAAAYLFSQADGSLAITRICAFDRRDFSIFRPRHCDYYDLLP